MLDRRTFLVALGSTALSSTTTYSQRITGDSTTRRLQTSREVLAFYYGWYGTRKGSGQWRHWNAPGAPPTAPSVDRPVLGKYDSHDPAVIAKHANWLRQAGITGIVSSWWGVDTFEDKSLALLLDPMRARGIKVAAYVETNKDGRAGAIRSLVYLIQRYANHPAWLRVEGRPVLFVYGGAIKALPAPEWAAAADAVAAMGLPKPVLIGDINARDGFFDQRAPAFEGLHTYVMAPYVAGMTLSQIDTYTDTNYPKWKARVGSRIYCATVIPGFDDRQVRGRPLPRPTVARRGTGTFDALWRAAIKTDAEWVLITSFNEWHEASDIEPSEEYGDLFLTRNRYWSDVYLGHH
jgi:glycoprotein endo-alpha-1,2-mannosidase